MHASRECIRGNSVCVIIPAAQNEVFDALPRALSAILAGKHSDVYDLARLICLVGDGAVERAVMEEDDVARFRLEQPG